MFPPMKNPYEMDYLNRPEMFPNLRFGGIYGDMSMPETAPPPQPNVAQPPQVGQQPPPSYAPPPEMAQPTQLPQIGRANEQFIEPLAPPTWNAPETPETPGGSFSVEEEMAKFQPQHEASDKFNQLIGQYPGREKPGLFQTIAASLAAFGPGGQNAGQEVMHGDYNRKIADWKNQTATAQQAANLERYENVNERTLRYQTVSAQLREAAQKERERNNERNALIREKRADAYDFKTRNPNWQLTKVQGGNVWGRNPTTNKWEDTGIATGTLSKTDEINLRIEGQMDLAQLNHENRLKELGQKNVFETEQKGIPQKREFSPSQMGAGTKPLTYSQQKNRELLAAQNVINSGTPLSKWVTKEPGGGFKITPPGEPASFWHDATGPTPEEHKQIRELIYGPQQGEINMDRNRADSIADDPQAPKSPPGWKYVRKPGGGWTAVRK